MTGDFGALVHGGYRRLKGSHISRFLIGVLLIVLVFVGPSLYGWATSSGRLAPELARTSGTVNVKITLPFAPGEFQQQELSKYGTFGGVQGERSIRLFNVSHQDLMRLKRIYWIEQISPGPRPGG
jgi:hypothetical protein